MFLFIQRMVIVTLGFFCVVNLGFAQSFPNKPIQIIVPVAAGGGTDLLARTARAKISEVLGSRWSLKTNWAQAAILT